MAGDNPSLASSSAQNILVSTQNHLSTLSSPQQIKEQNSSFGDASLMSPLLSPPDQLSLSPSQLGPLSPQSPIPLPPPSPINGQNESWDAETDDRSGKLLFMEKIKYAVIKIFQMLLVQVILVKMGLHGLQTPIKQNKVGPITLSIL